MMNEFGTPFNDAEMSMLPPGANKPHERMLAESGMEHNLFPVIAGAAMGALGGGMAGMAGMMSMIPGKKKKDKDGDKITVNIENILSKDEEKPNPYYNYLDLS